MARREWTIAVLLFVALLAAHAWFISIGWMHGNLPGNEFRQAQTALSAAFIQREGEFVLPYPTPVLGAPWSLPMEFPLYQWTVVALSEVTGWPLIQAGRAVTASCFYVGLAALFPLLGRLGLERSRRLVVMGLILSCPLYIFYSRSFLIESMVLAFSLWFLVAFVRFMARPGWVWFSAAVALGVLAGLVKITTFMVFLIPAGLLTCWEMSARWPKGRAIAAAVGARALAVIALPLAAAAWWTNFADGVKAKNPSAEFLRSTNLIDFNFGTAENRFSADTLARHWENLTQNLVAPAVLGVAALLALTLGRRWWRQILLCAGCYVATLALFPTLYAWHDYYAMTNAVLLLAAVGLALASALDARRGWLGWLLLLAVHGVQLRNYAGHYLPMQAGWSPGGSDLTRAVRAMTNADDAIVVAGYDWDSGVPFYSQRRALMVRRGMERDWRYLHAAFAAQVAQGERYSVFVGRGPHRLDSTLLGVLEQHFEIDPRPLFHWQDATVYGRKDERERMVDAVRRVQGELPGVSLDGSTAAVQWSMHNHEIEVAKVLTADQAVFELCAPRPWKFFTEFGFKLAEETGRPVMFAHAESRLWFRVPPGAHVVRAEFCLMREAYAESLASGDRSDGVEFYVDRERSDGTRERLKSVLLNPGTRPADGGFQTFEVPVGGAIEEVVIVGTAPGPNGSRARDWAAFSSIRVAPAR